MRTGGARVAACVLTLGGLGIVLATLAFDPARRVHAAEGSGATSLQSQSSVERRISGGATAASWASTVERGQSEGLARLGDGAATGALGAALVEAPRSVRASSVNNGDDDGGRAGDRGTAPISGGHTFGFEFRLREPGPGERPSDGPFTERFADGALALEGRYLNGERDGDWTSYHADGSVRLEGQYEAGRRVGRWRAFHPSGQLLGEGSFENHLREGLWVLYYSNGLVKERGVFEHDLRHGPWEFLDTFGQLEARSGYYRNGFQITPF